MQPAKMTDYDMQHEVRGSATIQCVDDDLLLVDRILETTFWVVGLVSFRVSLGPIQVLISRVYVEGISTYYYYI